MTQELLAQTEAPPRSPGKHKAASSHPVAEQGGSRSRFRAFLGWLGDAVPTTLLLAALAGLAYWGHHTGWTIPKFSELAGHGKADSNDWCAEHGVAESECVECNPDLMPRPKEYGFCKVHGIAECPLCHPEVAQVEARPKVTPEDLARARRALETSERVENNGKCKTHQRRLQFATKESVDKAGIDVVPVWESPMVESIAANGEITYDQTRVTRHSSRVPGTVWWVGKSVGDPVKRGEVLALIDAAEVGKAKSDYLQALALLDQKGKVLEAAENLIREGVYRKGALQQVEAQAAVREAEIRLVSAEQALLNLGFSVKTDELKGLSPQQLRAHLQYLGLPSEWSSRSSPVQITTSNLFPLRATQDGVVVVREVVPGEVVDASKPLMVVADVRHMWLTLDLRHEDIKRLSLGQPVRFRMGSNPKENEVTGKIVWISTAVDEKTRTVKVRADLPNPDGQLRSFTFGTGKVVLREEPKAVVVPNESVQWEGCCHVVFVRDKDFLKEGAPKVFHVRKVRVGTKDEQNTEIIAGVLPGEVVAAKGSGVLRGELLKNNLGEG